MDIASAIDRPTGFARVERAARLCASLAQDEQLWRDSLNGPHAGFFGPAFKAARLAEAEHCKARRARIAWFMARLAGRLALES